MDGYAEAGGMPVPKTHKAGHVLTERHFLHPAGPHSGLRPGLGGKVLQRARHDRKGLVGGATMPRDSQAAFRRSDCGAAQQAGGQGARVAAAGPSATCALRGGTAAPPCRPCPASRAVVRPTCRPAARRRATSSHCDRGAALGAETCTTARAAPALHSAAAPSHQPRRPPPRARREPAARPDPALFDPPVVLAQRLLCPGELVLRNPVPVPGPPASPACGAGAVAAGPGGRAGDRLSMPPFLAS